MTAMLITYGGETYTLTDEASQCSYGEPVLVAPNGDQLRAGEIAATVTETDEFWGNFFGEDSPRHVTAKEVAHKGTHAAADGCAFRDDADSLTDYGRATHAMFTRFSRQPV